MKDIPIPDPSPLARRGDGVWLSWLGSLTTNADAALACALTYESMSPSARERLIRALEEDAPSLAVSRMAVVAPFLAVEQDPARRARLGAVAGADTSQGGRPRLAWRGQGSWVVIAQPLYSGFVHAFLCDVDEARGIRAVFYEPFLHETAVLDTLSARVPEVASFRACDPRGVIDELAHAILAARRDGSPLPEGTPVLVPLFEASIGAA